MILNALNSLKKVHYFLKNAVLSGDGKRISIMTYHLVCLQLYKKQSKLQVGLKVLKEYQLPGSSKPSDMDLPKLTSFGRV